MNIFVIGANGQIGRHLVKDLVEQGNEVTAGIRKNSQAAFFEELGAKTAPLDLEYDDIDDISEKIKDADKVVFTAGSGGHTGADQTIIIDLDGAVKSIEASKKVGTKHFVLVSSFDTRRSAFEGDLKPYTIAKHYADLHLRNSGIPYTIVHPGGLTNDEGLGKVELAEEVEPGKVTRKDVASVLVEVLNNDKKIGQEFQVVSGDVDIKEAVDQFNN
ncbi:MAG TPA: SDR family NAD(P)-dependent oxidoreductase [Staphylococcus sp.]|uniref:SDR family oxidoreductase n=1 Tax=Mammaliicoccus vitulinus TaxID=71237 RepID=A0ABX7HCE4_9STAP|nr:SDR family oxidoreductase [Mammaliicoccus vitulinus]HAL10564.1 SDR family NAD(P)-dependent oxidoreductase [Staphylococcus sp.]MBM6628903.1 SDR family oxidoreductase [Mammaliicoccus vitulinus]MBO3075981.1 SDR family oxidoreductase [Mammaliicoccus vitulinus]PNZ36350.1 NAD(P)-dependent oxidoreductase [Mammaliicoccus vitulinus]QJF25937.1 SDR family oxidoreductase [Mammaliicoccus vitulinus]